MTQKDYVIRQLSELRQVLAAIVKLKNEKNFEKAYEMINAALNYLGGIKPQVIVAFNLEEILQMMSNYHHDIAQDKEKLSAIAQLAFEHGKIDAACGKEGASTVFYHKALSLLVHALKLDTSKPTTEEQSTLKELVKVLQGYELHDSMRSDIQQLTEVLGTSS